MHLVITSYSVSRRIRGLALEPLDPASSRKLPCFGRGADRGGRAGDGVGVTEDGRTGAGRLGVVNCTGAGAGSGG